MRAMLFCLAAIALAVTGSVAGIAAACPAAAAPGPCGRTAAPPAFRHVIWIWMENHSYSDIIGNRSQAPYLNSLASECGLAANYHSISHPSLPNYLAATSGLSRGHLPLLSYLDCHPSLICHSPAPSIFGQGETWKAYEESMPANCDGSSSGEYAASHNAPPYYDTLSGCASRDVPYPRLAADLTGNALPAFSFITPNVIDDMHNGTIADGDSWLARRLPAILNSRQYRSGTTAIFITWDEGAGGYPVEGCATNTTDASCRVATIVISPATPVGVISGTLFNHYSLLGTTEQLLGLPKLGQASSYPTMIAAFHL